MQVKLLEIIKKVLKTANTPLTAEALLKEISIQNLYEFKGKTPKTVIRARLSVDIDKNISDSEFIRLQRGKYGLRKWLIEYPGKYQEYEIITLKKKLMEEYLPVFDKNQLDEIINKNGLNIQSVDINWFKNNCYPMVRRDAEKNFTVVQLVSVFLIKFKNNIVTHTRSARSPESRLHGEKSIVFGGHITYEEINSLFDPLDPESSHPFIERELDEEIKITNGYKMKQVGLLYDKNREISSQHLGIVYEVIMNDENYEIGEKGYHINDELISITKVIENNNEYENWSQELISYLQKGINNA